MKKKRVHEFYGRLEESDRSFDLFFWQEQGLEAIFKAAEDLIIDYLLVKEGYAHKPRLQRTVESFKKKQL